MAVKTYAKRQYRKPKTSIKDVYEYEPGKNRRSNVRLELDSDEERGYGIDPDGEIGVDMDKEALQTQLIGETEDNLVIPSDDDEEIDSDAAFEESDEERFAGFFSAKGKRREGVDKKKKQSVRFADIDLNEEDEGEGQKDEEEDEDDDDDEMEGDEEEFFNLLDVLDGKVKLDANDDENDSAKPSPTEAEKLTHETDDEDEETGQNDEDSEEDEESEEDKQSEEDKEEYLDFTPSDDEMAPGALDELEDFLSTLETSHKKRKHSPDADGPTSQSPKRKKRQHIKERTEAGAENEFRAQSSGSKLRLEDFLAPLASQSSVLQALKKSTKALTSSSSKYSKTLSVPLPQRTQERLDREAAYEQTKDEVDKWKDTMRRIREADHLSFPLQEDSNMGRTSTLELAAKFKPSNELESSVDALLRAANMRDEAELVQLEDQMLLANKLTLDEVAQRRDELRGMRELMFRAELKARRVNKIKSKTYRRLKRKEKEKLSGPSKKDEGGKEEDGEERMKRERERAMERATLRHKHTGKWSRQLKAKGEHMGEDERRDMEEMLTRGEKLRRRIEGMGSDASENDEESDEDDGEGGSDKIKQSAFDELQRVNEQDKQLESPVNGGTKSVFNMKFMRQAMGREKARADKMADDFLKELTGIEGADDDEEHGGKETDGVQGGLSSEVVSQRVGGRVVYRPGAQTITPRPMNSLASDTSSVTLKSTDLLSPPYASISNKTVRFMSTTGNSPVSQSKYPAEDRNPWLTRPEAVEATSKSLRKNEVIISKDSKSAEKSKNKLRKLARKRGEEKEKAKDDAALEIEMEKVLILQGPNAVPRVNPAILTSTPVNDKNVVPKKAGSKEKVKTVVAEKAVDDGYDSENNSEIEAQERALKAKNKGVKAFQQRDLVALAFAGDNVVQQFEETKRRDTAADAPKEVDTTIPGWGTWGGIGVHKAPPKPSRIKKIPGIEPTTRADYGKKHVIISERRDKKAAKYMVKDLPFPYTSKAQFERSMENPLGTEWNTRVGFQRATLPRVVTKPGVIIMPLKKFS